MPQGSSSAAWHWTVKEDADTGEPAHELCPTCYESDQISILQPRGSFLRCDSCKASYRTEKHKPLQRIARI